MYSYNNNMARFKQNMYPTNINYNDERFAGGFVAPLLLGGVAGYAIGNANRPNYYYPQPYYYYPYLQYPTYYSNNYYYNPYN